MKKLAQLSNPVLYGIAVLLLMIVYFVAIQPTVKLYGALKELRSVQDNNISEGSPIGSLKELQKLDELLAKLHPKQNLQTKVLNAVGNRKVKLQSFREVKIEENEFGGEKNISKYVLLVSGSYKELLSLAGDLKGLAISSSSISINEQQEEMLNLNILVAKNETE